VDAEGVPDVTELYPVESVPTSVLLRGGVAQPIATLEGANAVQLTQLVTQHSRASAAAAPAAAATAPATAASSADAAAAPVESKEQLNARLAQLVSASPVMAFIKGTPAAPRCGFTKQLLALLNEQGVQFGSFDILSDSAVREGLKAYSNWPTYPQLYVSGELVGGLDIVKELAASGELAASIPAGHIQPKEAEAAAGGVESEAALNARLQSLTRSNRVMLFMKGSPAAPQCGFSRKVLALLEEAGCAPASEGFGTFDILSDPAVREGLKKLSNWPTYPQLYIDGEARTHQHTHSTQRRWCCSSG
jgi:Grx4 family monothiol glutaredoxin